MPNDPTLYPSIPNPQQQVIQRQGALEARVAALESRRDLVVTPFAFTTGGSASMPWYGGRTWIVFGGRVTTSDGVTGQRQLGMDARINGVGAIGLTGNWVLASGLTGTPNAAAAFPINVAEFSAVNFRGLYAVTPGASFTISAVATFSTQGYSASGLVVEWPQA